MRNRVDERLEAQHVRDEDQLVAPVVAHLARLDQQVACAEPLVVGELNLTCKGVQVLHETVEHLLGSRVGVRPAHILAGLGVRVQRARVCLRHGCFAFAWLGLVSVVRVGEKDERRV